MKRTNTLNEKTIENLKKRILFHYELSNLLSRTQILMKRYNDEDIFYNVEMSIIDSMDENEQCFEELLKDLYIEWSGIQELRAAFFRPYTPPANEMIALQEEENQINEDHIESSGCIEKIIFHKNVESGCKLPKDFLREVVKEIPQIQINSNTLTI